MNVLVVTFVSLPQKITRGIYNQSVFVLGAKSALEVCHS